MSGLKKANKSPSALAVLAVRIAFISAAIFPGIREFTGKIFQIKPQRLDLLQNLVLFPVSYRQIPYS